MRDQVPRTAIAGTIAGQPFTIEAPKDCELQNLEVVAAADGTVKIKVESLVTRMNPEVITTTADGLAKQITAAGNLTVEALRAAGALAP
jgi:hypothetical protein